MADLTDGGELYQFVRLGKGCLSYMVISEGEAAVIDAVRFTEVFTNFAKEKDVEIKHVFDTHLHADQFQVVVILQLKQVQRIIYHQKMQKK